MAKSTVTYSPEDNKLRLYVGRVPRDEYDRLRDAGFISTPKQDCDFVAVWTPGREDLASEYLDDGEDIGDEDYSPEERAAAFRWCCCRRVSLARKRGQEPCERI